MRTGLLGASAAMAMGAVAVASGLLPGPGGLGSPQGGDRVQAGGPTDLESQPVPSSTASDHSSDPAASRAEERNDGPLPTPSRERGRPAEDTSASPSPSRERETPDQARERHSARPDRSESDRAPATGGEETGNGGTSSTTSDPETAAEREVLALVNQERAKEGCKPVRADGDLAELAAGFSEDMAKRGFFAHTSPDGKSPWDRAEALGISDLGGENIARGQANAQSVMDSWMNSPGHKANILNCDYRTMGVGAHFAEGGPWWTQDFGF
ncbi:CAP domain-containing protein [Streptomyces iconiensis]|uniref:CAP domain-containing protein n=1 Tax=Streptomyces iconiensis TaxID=1384038 RepID=A0ABT6ZUL7_9ACTN|nr:CAP domain-containing protein [Streptomyces iconiensis]